MTLPDVPPPHVWEARAGLGEVDRLAAGQPAVDPAASRVHLPPAPKPAVRLYVAPMARTPNAGTRAQPFATLAHARDAVRALRPLPPAESWSGARRRVPDDGELCADGGRRRYGGVARRLRRRAGRDAGTSGAVSLAASRRCRTRTRWPDCPRRRAAMCCKRTCGRRASPTSGSCSPTATGRSAVPIPELFFNGRPMTLARWPNTGFVRTGKVTDAGDGGRAWQFEYDGDRARALGRRARRLAVWLLVLGLGGRRPARRGHRPGHPPHPHRHHVPSRASVPASASTPSTSWKNWMRRASGIWTAKAACCTSIRRAT